MLEAGKSLKLRGRFCNSDSKKQPEGAHQAHRLMQAPFNLQTEERGRKKTKKTTDTPVVCESEEKAAFKARKMPTYKFFEVAKASEGGAIKEP